MKSSSAKWYFQSKRRLSLFHCSLALEVVAGRELERVVGDHYRHVYLPYRNGIHESYLDMASVRRLWKKSTALVLHKKHFLSSVEHDLDSTGAMLLRHTRHWTLEWCARATVLEFEKDWNIYRALYQRLYGLFVVAAIADRPLLEKVRGMLATNGYTDKQATEIITAMTDVGHKTFVGMEQRALYQFADAVDQQARWKRTVINSSVPGGLRSQRALWGRFQAYVRRWRWVPHDMEGQVWSDQEMFDRLRRAVAAVRPKAMHINAGAWKPVPHDARIICTILRRLILLRERRKYFMSKSGTYLDAFLDELGARLNIDRTLLMTMIPDEVSNAIKTGSVHIDELRARQHMAIADVVNGKIRWVPENRQDMVLEELGIRAPQHKQTVFRGIAASPGLVEGPARLISSPEEAHRVQKGDILVAINTTPEYLLAITRAKGIVADDSATITCHAATVAREYKIPCVVGTRSVMAHVRDGDRIRVDAYKGEVTILKLSKSSKISK